MAPSITIDQVRARERDLLATYAAWVSRSIARAEHMARRPSMPAANWNGIAERHASEIHRLRELIAWREDDLRCACARLAEEDAAVAAAD